MAHRINLNDNNDELVRILETYFQSGNLNFLIGSGASMPAIQVAGNIEAKINELLADSKEEEADLVALNFIEEIETQNDLAAIGRLTGPASQTPRNYTEFLSALDSLLFERKNILLPRQANVFTTNYDLFFEYAAGEIPSLILNDGFDRSKNMDTGSFPFSPELYFDRTYRSGAVHDRQIEIPTINLIKLHGSLSWEKRCDGVCFNTSHPDAIDDDKKKDQTEVADALEKRALILPNLQKFKSTLLDRIYYDLLRARPKIIIE